jgi:competence protein ComEA
MEGSQRPEGLPRERGARARALAALLALAAGLSLARAQPGPPLADCPRPAPFDAVEGARVDCRSGSARGAPLPLGRLFGLAVDLNALGAEDFESLPGIGPKLARHIVEVRAQKGGFASVEDLAQVKGIGPARLATLRAALGQDPP